MGKWKSVARVITYPIMHPANTARTTLNIGKNALITGGAGYVGWEMLTTDKSAARVVSEAVIGENATDHITGAVTGASELLEGSSQRLEEATASLNTASQGLNGISNFLGNLTNGNAGNMFSNFFGNLTSGKMSGLGIAGLVGAAMLIFGRTGWFGKIAGGLLAMLLIGNNSQRQSNGQQQNAGLPYSRASVYSPENDSSKVFIKAWDSNGRELPAVELTSQRYQELNAQKMTPMQIYHQMNPGQMDGLQPDREEQAGMTR